MNTLRTIVKIKKARKAMTNPTIAAIIVFLALSTLALSPPESIHRIPPQIRKKRAINTAATNIIVIAVETTVGMLDWLIPQRVLNCPIFGPHGLTF